MSYSHYHKCYETLSDIIEKWKTNIIASCCLGISQINFGSNLLNEPYHSAILLLQNKFILNMMRTK